MKKIYLTLAMAMAGFLSYAQTNTFPSSGNVGIGTLSPGSKLEVNGDVNFYPTSNYTTPATARQLTIGEASNNSLYKLALGYYYESGTYTGVVQSTHGGAGNNLLLNPIGGNVGIGTTSPGATLNVVDAGTSGVTTLALNNKMLFRGDGVLNWGGSANYGVLSWDGSEAIVGGQSSMNLALFANGSEKMRVTTSGNVAIGTTDPQGYKLAVNGDAIATSMTVKLHSAWPDYVLKSTYKLPALADVKNFIDKNHHLPDMPSEQQVAKDGLNLGEMNRLLAKKVEELTLYLIAQQKENEAMKKQIATIQNKIAHHAH